MNILVISGSTRERSRARGVSHWVVNQLKSKNIEVTLFDLGKEDLPMYKGGDESNHLNVQKLKALAEEADGFFITTPEYHSGMSGALKNALDFLGSAQFKGKPATIVATSGGGKGGINALNSLRTVLRGVYAFTLPGQFVADPKCFNDDWAFVEEDAQERVNVLLEELATVTTLFTKEKIYS
jgi:azobenzene reductase